MSDEPLCPICFVASCDPDEPMPKWAYEIFPKGICYDCAVKLRALEGQLADRVRSYP